MAEREFDVVVLGAGPAGEVCAGRVGQGALDVAIVEHHLVGGECSYYACMPSKALLRPGELLDEVERVPGAREAVTGGLDVGAALRRRDEVIHNREATTAEQAPTRLLVLGGGAVGVELAQAWASLGSSVTLVEAADRVLPPEEPFASAQVTDGLERAGVEVRVDARAEAASRGEGGHVTLRLAGSDEVRGDELLVAVGRRPRTDGIGLQKLGIDPGGHLETDDQLRVGGREWL